MDLTKPRLTTWGFPTQSIKRLFRNGTIAQLLSTCLSTSIEVWHPTRRRFTWVHSCPLLLTPNLSWPSTGISNSITSLASTCWSYTARIQNHFSASPTCWGCRASKKCLYWTNGTSAEESCSVSHQRLLIGFFLKISNSLPRLLMTCSKTKQARMNLLYRIRLTPRCLLGKTKQAPSPPKSSQRSIATIFRKTILRCLVRKPFRYLRISPF